MKKYRVKFYLVDYIEREYEVEANDKDEAFEIAQEKSDNGEGYSTLVKWRTWKKPTVQLIKKAKS